MAEIRQPQELYETSQQQPLILLINKVGLASSNQVQYPQEIQTVVMTAAA